MYASDGKDIKEISGTEYAQNRDKYRLLTNQDLMALRENSPKYSYDTELLRNAQNAVGMNSVVDQAMKIIKEFGSTETTTYTRKSKEVQSGLDKIIGNGPDGVYKITSKRQLTEDRDAKAALQYVYNALPRDFKNALSAHTAGNLGTPGTEDDLVLLAQMIQRNVDIAIKPDFDNTATAAHASGGSGSSTSTKTQELGEAYQTGSG